MSEPSAELPREPEVPGLAQLQQDCGQGDGDACDALLQEQAASEAYTWIERAAAAGQPADAAATAAAEGEGDAAAGKGDAAAGDAGTTRRMLSPEPARCHCSRDASGCGHPREWSTADDRR